MSRKPKHAQPLALHPLRVAVLSALAILPAVAPAATIPSGMALDASEISVNSTVFSDQDVPRVARDAAGDSVVVWSSFDQASGTSSWDVVAQRYNAAGQPQGGEILVNTFTTGFQNHPSVAMDAAGDFVVAWQSYNQASGTSKYDIFARQFNAAGAPVQANEFLVNTADTANNQASPSVAMDATGDFVVAWNSVGQAAAGHVDIFARTYNAAGAAQQANEFVVNSLSILISTHTTPSVAMDTAGDFVVAWQVLDQASGSSGYDIFAQRYNAAAQAQGGEIQVNTVIANNQLDPSVAMDAAGDFVVAWDSYDQVSGSSLEDVYARQFNANGTAVQASEFLVNTITTNRQNTPSVAMDAAGDFVVAWASYDQVSGSSKHDIYARQFNAAGTPVQANEFLVNTFTTSEQMAPAVAADAAGDFIVAWQSYNQIASSSYDVFARRFQGPEQLDLAATLAASSSSVNGGASFSVTLGLNNNTAVTTFGNAAINAALGVASGVTADFTLPAGVTLGTVAGSNWSCGTPANNVMTCTYNGSVAAATAIPGLTVNFTAPAGTSAAVNLPFQANVSSTRQDSNNANDTGSTTVQVKAVGGSGGGGGGGSGGGGYSSGGGGAMDLLSLASLGLPLLFTWFTGRRRQRR